MSTLVIIDLGLGNPSSVRNMVQRLGHEAVLRSTPEGLGSGDRYVLPGVGAFDEGIRRLHDSGWFGHIRIMPAHTSILGICLGMQLLAESSEEGVLEGVGRISAEFVRFRGAERVPHMGWNKVSTLSSDPIFDPEMSEHRYYFSHTYRSSGEAPSAVIGRTTHGEEFTSAYKVDGTYGVQFHPEKSHRYGKALLKRWIEL